jgi:hypothetical protein
VTPLVLEKTVWAGTNLGSYQQAVDALEELADISLAPKQVQRITSRVGGDCVQERRDHVEQHRRRPLMERVGAPAGIEPPDLAAVMMDGGRFQRCDHFQRRKPPAGKQSALSASRSAASASAEKATHWREDKVGIVLSMQSDVHAADPCPDFPAWLSQASVVAELAQLAAREEESEETCWTPSGSCFEEPGEAFDWRDLAPGVLSREVIASSDDAQTFGWHLDWKAWTRGVFAAKRQAFVADGLAVNWTIHKEHFSQMTPILDLMHALSYAWRAAAGLDDPQAYGRFAAWIWLGQVQRVIEELQSHQARLGASPPDASASDPRERIQRAITYYTNHKSKMDYPRYRQQGLPLTSSHIESTIKQINTRVKGTEKFWNQTSGNAVLQLRADSLSDSRPLDSFWRRWRNQQTGANTYRTLNV